MDAKSIYWSALDVYGLKNQLLVAIEECSELQKEITKVLRVDPTQAEVAHLSEEIADTEIMLEQLQEFFSLHHKVTEIRGMKLERLEKRIARDRARVDEIHDMLGPFDKGERA